MADRLKHQAPSVYLHRCAARNGGASWLGGQQRHTGAAVPAGKRLHKGAVACVSFTASHASSGDVGVFHMPSMWIRFSRHGGGCHMAQRRHHFAW